jgi:hypothetical protein
MNGIKIGKFTFLIDNSGLLITTTKGDEEDTERFDPEESLRLLNFLSQHEGTFNAAVKPSEPPFGSKEWQNDYLERKFSEMES